MLSRTEPVQPQAETTPPEQMGDGHDSGTPTVAETPYVEQAEPVQPQSQIAAPEPMDDRQWEDVKNADMATVASTQYVEQFEHVCKHAELTWSVLQDYEKMTGIKMIGLFEPGGDGKMKLYCVCDNEHMLPEAVYTNILAKGYICCPFCFVEMHTELGRELEVYRRDQLDEHLRLPPEIPHVFKRTKHMIQTYLLHRAAFDDINNPRYASLRGDFLSDIGSFTFEWHFQKDAIIFDWTEAYFIASTRCDEFYKLFLDILQGPIVQRDGVHSHKHDYYNMIEGLRDFLRSRMLTTYKAEIAQEGNELARVYQQIGHAPDSLENSLVGVAAHHDMWDHVQSMLTAIPSLANFIHTNKESVLSIAVQRNQTPTVACLLAAGANADGYTAKKDSLVAVAAYQNQWQIVELLLDAGASINSSIFDESLISIAVQRNVPDISFLLDRGPIASTTTASGESLGVVAAKLRNWHTVATLCYL